MPNLAGVERLAETWAVAPRRRSVPRRSSVACVEPAHPRRPPLRQRRFASDRSRTATPRRPSTSSECRCGWWPATSTPAKRWCSRPDRSSLRCSRVRRSRACSHRSATTGACSVDGAVVDTVPLSHALAGPVDRVYVLNIGGELLEPLAAIADRRCDPRVRDQPQAALRGGAAERAGERRRGRAVRDRSTTARSRTSPIPRG